MKKISLLMLLLLSSLALAACGSQPASQSTEAGENPEEIRLAAIVDLFFDAPNEAGIHAIYYGSDWGSAAALAECQPMFTGDGWLDFTKDSFHSVASFHDILSEIGAVSYASLTEIKMTDKITVYLGEELRNASWSTSVTLKTQSGDAKYDITGTFLIDTDGKIADFGIDSDGGLFDTCRKLYRSK